MKKVIIVTVALIALMISAAGAEEMFGVPVYPAAKLHKAETKRYQDQYHSEAIAVYRTTGSSSKVVNFYKKHSGIKGGKAIGKITYFHVANGAENKTVEIQVMPSVNPATGKKLKGSTSILITTRQMH